LDSSLTNLLSKRIIVAESKEMKTESNLAKFSEEDNVSKNAVLPMMIIFLFIYGLFNDAVGTAIAQSV
jgi:hypothetical protein